MHHRQDGDSSPVTPVARTRPARGRGPMAIGVVPAAMVLLLAVLPAFAANEALDPAGPTAVAAGGAPHAAGGASHAAGGAQDERPVADDLVLLEELERAIDLRRREDFDRMLDARDPGELVEHATLRDHDFDRRRLAIDTLFLVGDELFAYPFRPENGWGSGPRPADDPTFTPTLSRVHRGAAGGPDAFACASCHSKGGPDGAGTHTEVALLRGDGLKASSADQRDAPHLLGLGPVQLLAAEMSAELAAAAEEARRRSTATGARAEAALVAKGVSFGVLGAWPDGRLDTGGVRGVSADLVVRPFGWKGHQATLRAMVEESLHLHQGLLSRRVQLAVRDGLLASAPYGDGPWHDLDRDGVSLEIDDGMLTTEVGYLAQLEVPVTRPPRDPGLLDLFARGRGLFETTGCAACHVPALELRKPFLDATDGVLAVHDPFVIDVAVDGDGPKVEPTSGNLHEGFLVHLFSDLRRHDMGAALASPADEGDIPAREFLTRPLWGLAGTAPYLHDGRAASIEDAILLHGGEAAGARDAFAALDEDARAALRVFLASLSRQPKLFVP